MPDPSYVPILKGRQGEFAALADLQPATRQTVLPLLEIVPGPDETVATLKTQINKSVTKLARPWTASEALIDAGYLPTDMTLSDDLGVVAYAVATARDKGVLAIPVLRLNDEERVRSDCATLHADWSTGVAVRLTPADLEDDPEDTVDALAALLRSVQVSEADTDLILDLGEITGDLAVHAGARFSSDLIRALPDPHAYRRLVVAGGAFPVDLSQTEAHKLGRYPRYDAQMYDRLVTRKRLPRQPLFGDYAVTHPRLSIGPAFAAPPQLRYTVAESWLVLKGRRNDPRGHDQFHHVCSVISSQPEFAGASLGNADDRIAHSTEYGPGNASTWRQIGTTHHLDYVVRRLTTLGEP